jgi:hypothetical protein
LLLLESPRQNPDTATDSPVRIFTIRATSAGIALRVDVALFCLLQRDNTRRAQPRSVRWPTCERVLRSGRYKRCATCATRRSKRILSHLFIDTTWLLPARSSISCGSFCASSAHPCDAALSRRVWSSTHELRAVSRLNQLGPLLQCTSRTIAAHEMHRASPPICPLNCAHNGWGSFSNATYLPLYGCPAAFFSSRPLTQRIWRLLARTSLQASPPRCTGRCVSGVTGRRTKR